MKYPGVKVLTFDVGGTVFDWRGTIEAELRALSAEKGVKLDVRQFATDWRSSMFEMLARVKTGELPRMNADAIHRRVLDDILENHNAIHLSAEEKGRPESGVAQDEDLARCRWRNTQIAKSLFSHHIDRIEFRNCSRLL